MGQRDHGIDRILIVHPDAESRRASGAAVRRVVEGPVTLFEASSGSEGLRTAGGVDPRVVLLDVGGDRGLILEIVRELRRPDRLIVGLYDPLVAGGGGLDFLREAVRAGVGDFIPLPPSDDELAAALDAARRDAEGPAEGRTVTFLSPKGGVGTTTLAANAALLAAELAAGNSAESSAGNSAGNGVGNGVALCDFALQWGDAAELLGVTPDRDVLDLIQDLDRLVALPTYLAEEPETGLRILPAPRDAVAAEEITPEDLSRVLIVLRRRFDLVVVDAPPRLDALTLAALDLSETIVVVTEAVAPTVQATGRFLEALAALGFEGDRVRVVVNRHASFEGNFTEAAVAEHLGRTPDAVVPDDEAAVVAAHRGVPAVFTKPKSKFTQAVRQLANELLQAGGRPSNSSRSDPA